MSDQTAHILTADSFKAHLRQLVEAKQSELYYAYRDALIAHDAAQREQIAQARREEREAIQHDFIRQALEIRGVDLEYACPECSGFGVKAYANTTTWRKGSGGQAITNGICDACWGSGDKHRPWMSLKRYEQDMRRLAELEQTAIRQQEGA